MSKKVYTITIHEIYDCCELKHETKLFQTLEEALDCMRSVKEEARNNYPEWEKEDESNKCYERYSDGYECCNRIAVFITEHNLNLPLMSKDFVNELTKLMSEFEDNERKEKELEEDLLSGKRNTIANEMVHLCSKGMSILGRVYNVCKDYLSNVN